MSYTYDEMGHTIQHTPAIISATDQPLRTGMGTAGLRQSLIVLSVVLGCAWLACAPLSWAFSNQVGVRQVSLSACLVWLSGVTIIVITPIVLQRTAHQPELRVPFSMGLSLLRLPMVVIGAWLISAKWPELATKTLPIWLMLFYCLALAVETWSLIMQLQLTNPSQITAQTVDTTPQTIDTPAEAQAFRG